jgi:bifunctional enzyme CysN/CysC
MSNSNGHKNDFNDKYLDMDLLRFTTAGSVDDGKSTLDRTITV